MSQINVLVVDISRDVKAKGIAEAVLKRRDRGMNLVRGLKGSNSLFVAIDEVEPVLKSLSSETPCALVLVSRATERDERSLERTARRPHNVTQK